jgi:carboxyl-terminal processing protease
MRRTAVLALVAAASVAFAIGVVLHPVSLGARRPSELQQVRSELAARYYRRLPSAVLSEPTIPKLLAALHDPYTAYLTPAEYRVARRAFASGYGGVGITVLPAPGGLLVRRTSVGSVHVTGIRPGDTILAVDGASTARLSYHEAVGRILGVPGTTVRLRVRRGQHTLEVKLMRQQFRVHPVHARLEGHIGVIHISTFSRGSADATRTAIERLAADGATAYVIDLRGNPGGLLSQAVSISSLFLRDGSIVASLAGAHRPLRIVYAHGNVAVTAPLAVLVDPASASASEVVAGALKDHGRATILGLPTYGKSYVQQIDKLPSGAALKLTVARYLTPAGHDISDGGVRPDIFSQHALAAALHLLAGRRS